MLETLKREATEGMDKALQAFRMELSKIRTGRAHPGLLEGVKVDYYGSETPLKSIATIGVSDTRTLTVTPWDRNLVKIIEKAIQGAGLGLNPISDVDLVRIPIPALTGERRKELVKVVKSLGEGAKVSVRNLRREALDKAKNGVKNKEISEDLERRIQEEVQKLTDRFVIEIDKAGAAKEQDLLSV